MLQILKRQISARSSVTKFALLLCAVLILSIGIGSTFSYVTTGTPTLINLFLNGMNPDGDLVIQKTVSHPFGDTYTIPEDLNFTFEVNMGSEYAGKNVKTTQGEKTADENGVITVFVVPGGRITVYDIDDGTNVTVTETNLGRGFTPDAVSRELTIQKYKDNSVIFANTYLPEKADTSVLTVSGVKTLVGREWIEADSFTFDLSVYQNGTWSSLGTQTITYELVEQTDPENPEKTVLVPKSDFDKFDFTELIRSFTFDKAGTYSFRVSEVEGTIGGLTYDKAESKFEILVGDVDMDGYLEIQSVTTTSENTAIENTTVGITFENKYAPVGSTEAFIEITKVLEDTSGQNKSPAGFTFELYDESGNLYKTSELTGSTGETSIRLVYEPTEAGKTFNYVLKETGSGQTVGALTYDDNAYNIKTAIVDNLDGTISAFVYDNDSIVSDGNAGDGKTSDGSHNTVSDGNAVAALADNVATVSSGNVAIDGTNNPTLSIPKDATNIYQATFTNRYDPRDASVAMAGSKVLNGRTLRDGEFTFQLYRTNELFQMADTAMPLATATNDGAGTFDFPTLQLDRVGTYYYIVNEDTTGALRGVTYDGSYYLVTITVSDVEGVLNAATTVTDAYGEHCTIEFENTYLAAPVSLPLSGKKILSGARLKEGEFSFELYVADENFTPQDRAFQTTVNDEDGKFTFKDLTFTKAGTYRYVVTEDSTEAIEGMVYDDTVYHITVTVADPGDGQLVIEEIHLTADGRPTETILFENSYTEPEESEEPSESGKPSEPTDSSESEKPSESEPTDTGESGEPSESAEPSESVEPSESIDSGEADDPDEPDRSSESDVSEDSTKANDPKTGDDNNVLPYIIALIISGLAAILLLVNYRRRKR